MGYDKTLLLFALDLQGINKNRNLNLSDWRYGSTLELCSMVCHLGSIVLSSIAIDCFLVEFESDSHCIFCSLFTHSSSFYNGVIINLHFSFSIILHKSWILRICHLNIYINSVLFITVSVYFVFLFFDISCCIILSNCVQF